MLHDRKVRKLLERPRKPSLLFVSDDAGERAWIAEAMARRMTPGNVAVASAGFETREWHPRLEELLQEQGLPTPAERLPRILDQYRADQRFDCVISLAETGELGLGDTFRTYVESLFGASSRHVAWEVPALGLYSRPEQVWKLEVLEGIARIRDEAAWLLAWHEAEPAAGGAIAA